MATNKLSFIDLFAGCGGISLGLTQAGLKGILSIEKNSDAFETLKSNLIKSPNFEWPKEIPLQNHDVVQILTDHGQYFRKIAQKVDVLCGGPPCQGFSTAGKRNPRDKRNQLFKKQIEFVRIIKPKVVILENVVGIKSLRYSKTLTFSEKIRHDLEKLGYEVEQQTIKANDFGVPQIRPRFFSVGIHTESVPELSGKFFEKLMEFRPQFLKDLGLNVTKPVSTESAISDLETKGKALTDCDDEYSPSGFKEIVKNTPRTPYQRLMAKSAHKKPNSMRLARHKPETVEKFLKIMHEAPKGKSLSQSAREELGIKKHTQRALARDECSPTLTTLPDDLIHYSEPRILTVREYARIQSFPDWFEFHGKFTTGGNRRAHECPRYTQVGNAIPPLVSLAFGKLLNMYL